ncbi:MAG: DUF4783 domain-containing protein [Bacteroidales bacterium]
MKKFFLISILLLAGYAGITQVVSDKIIQAFESGDAKELATYFHNNLEMKILNKEQVASKNQATRIIQEFFKEYPPVSFKINYEGTQQDSKYGLGTLETGKGSFRINLYFMEGRTEKIIYYLSIEKI